MTLANEYHQQNTDPLRSLMMFSHTFSLRIYSYHHSNSSQYLMNIQATGEINLSRNGRNLLNKNN